MSPRQERTAVLFWKLARMVEAKADGEAVADTMREIVQHFGGNAEIRDMGVKEATLYIMALAMSQPDEGAP
jgi:hypothetical protein